ncbi:MAG TPA: tetratricopeptide repeat protein [Saprospiraceae bacterium]|nr:tetratricopeptide repeat protein [Saprospiraceae bacterium]
MGKVIQFTPDKSRRRALKIAGQKPDSDDKSGQLNLFEAQQRSVTIQPIRAFTDPFVKGLYLHEQNHPQTEVAYLEAIARHVHVADAYCNLAIIYSAKGDDVRAIESLSQALATDPTHAESHYNLGNLYLDHGDLRLSRLHYELALKFHPHFPEAYFNLGILYLLRNERRKAVEMLRKYEELVPGGLDEIDEILQGKG